MTAVAATNIGSSIHLADLWADRYLVTRHADIIHLERQPALFSGLLNLSARQTVR